MKTDVSEIGIPMEGYVIDISFSEGTVFIDKVKKINGVPYYLLDDNTLGDSLGVGRRVYDTREQAVQAARLRIEDRMRSMLEKCR